MSPFNFIRMSLHSAEYELSSVRPRQALDRLLVLQALDPYSDQICRLVLRSYADLGDFIGFRKHYDKYKELLQRDLGIRPDHVIDSWVQKVL